MARAARLSYVRGDEVQTMRVRVSSKGQVALPKEIRERRGFDAGVVVEIEEVPGGVLLKLVEGRCQATLEDLLGSAGYKGPRKSLADMEVAIREGARGRR
jgi:AbrB family looped-hinge helix DNA binding protein